jgi:hypothetical protein
VKKGLGASARSRRVQRVSGAAAGGRGAAATSLFAARIHCGVAGRKISHQSARFTEVAAHYHLIYYTYSRRGDGGAAAAAARTHRPCRYTHARSFACAYFLPTKYESAKCWTKLSVLTPPENQCGVREWMMYRIAFTSH